MFSRAIKPAKSLIKKQMMARSPRWMPIKSNALFRALHTSSSGSLAKLNEASAVVQPMNSPRNISLAESNEANLGSEVAFALYRNRCLEVQKYGMDPSDLDKQTEKKMKMARNTKLGCYIVFGSLSLGIMWFFWENSGPQRDSSGALVTDQYTGSWLAYFYRCKDAAKLWINAIAEPSREVLLPPPLPAPYHQPKYTVVVEIKNVLVHPEWTYSTGHRFKKRPALEYFLDVVGYPNFELVVYTSESGQTADPMVRSLDSKQKIMHHLYRDCTKYVNGHCVKDLNRLGRDLKKVIFIDFDPDAFQLNPENVLRIPEWKGNTDDSTLVDLAELLKTIFMSDVDDVRPILQHYSQFDDPAAEFKRRALLVAELQKQEDSEKN